MTDDLVKRLRSPEVFIDTGGMFSPVANEAANCIEQLEAALQRINRRLNDDDSWLAQSIDCRNIAEQVLGENK